MPPNAWGSRSNSDDEPEREEPAPTGPEPKRLHDGGARYKNKQGDLDSEELRAGDKVLADDWFDRALPGQTGKFDISHTKRRRVAAAVARAHPLSAPYRRHVPPRREALYDYFDSKWKGGNTHEFRNRSMGSGKAKFATIVRER